MNYRTLNYLFETTLVFMMIYKFFLFFVTFFELDSGQQSFTSTLLPTTAAITAIVENACDDTIEFFVEWVQKSFA